MLIRQTLQQYSAAMTAMNADSAAQVYPGVDRRGLQNSFSGMRSHNYQLTSGAIQISGNSATARCVLRVQVDTKQGGRQPSQNMNVVIQLTKTANRWIIARLNLAR